MARWHFSINESKFLRMSRTCKKAGLKKNGKMIKKKYQIAAYKKRAVNNENFLKINDDFICFSGTIIYKNKIGKNALKEMYHSIKKRKISEVRNEMIGHFAMAIKIKNKIYFFIDNLGTFNLYYSKKDTVLSNNLMTVAKGLEKIKVDEIKIMSYLFFKENIGEDSIIKGIKRIYSDEIIEIDIENEKMKIKKIKNKIFNPYEKNKKIQENVNIYEKLIIKQFRTFNVFDTINLYATGGMDTRMILAALKKAEVNFSILHGTNDETKRCALPSDKPIIKDFSKKENIKVKYVDWSQKEGMKSARMKEYFEKLGFMYRIYGSPINFFHELEYDMLSQLQMGGFTSATTNSKPWEDKKEEYTTKDIINSLIPEKIFKAVKEKEKVYAEISNQIKKYIEHLPFIWREKNEKEKFVYALLFIHKRIPSRYINFFNEFYYYIAPFLTKELFDPLLSVPLYQRNKDKFQILLIKNMEKNYLKYPIYSGGKKINMNTKENTVGKEKNIKNEIVEKINIEKINKVTNYKAINCIEFMMLIMENNTSHIKKKQKIIKNLKETEFTIFISNYKLIDMRYLDDVWRIIFGINQLLKE